MRATIDTVYGFTGRRGGRREKDVDVFGGVFGEGGHFGGGGGAGGLDDQGGTFDAAVGEFAQRGDVVIGVFRAAAFPHCGVCPHYAWLMRATPSSNLMRGGNEELAFSARTSLARASPPPRAPNKVIAP